MAIGSKVNKKQQAKYIKALGERVRKAREAKFGVGSKRELGRRANVADATIYRIEHGQVITNIAVLIGIAFALEMPLAELLDLDGVEKFRPSCLEPDVGK
jgi:transcriptional regulator with XRE-family HTH domain